MTPDYTLDFAYAKQVLVKLDQTSTIPLVATFTDVTDENNPVLVDLTNYAFEFRLKQNNDYIKDYVIRAGEMSNSFLTKSGTSNATLGMQNMWADIKNLVDTKSAYALIMIQTTSNGQTFVAIKFTLSVADY